MKAEIEKKCFDHFKQILTTFNFDQEFFKNLSMYHNSEL